MRIILTVTISKSKSSFDIQVNRNQRIIDTLAILENSLSGRVSGISTTSYVQSERTRRKINTEYTYHQAGVYTGDHFIL